jgi:glycosyltransferase involved in cell wall biosynthesis
MQLDFHSMANVDYFGYGQAYFSILPELRKVIATTDHNLSERYTGGDVQIYFAVPFDQLRESWIRKSDRFLCFTMWESTVVSPEVIENLKNFDGLIVPSDWCAEIFKANGYAGPIYVAPLGINPDRWQPIRRDHLRVPFRILWQGTAIRDRKGCLETIRAFNELNLPGTQLYLKSMPAYTSFNFDTRFSMKDIQSALDLAGVNDKANRIFVRNISRTLSREDMYALLLDCDLSVYPSRGEGFGLIPLEHMSTGLPLVLANNSGMKMYANPDYMKLLSYEERCSSQGPETGVDYEANHEEIKEAILWAYHNRCDASNMGIDAAEWVLENWSYANTAKRLVEIAEEVHA